MIREFRVTIVHQGCNTRIAKKRQKHHDWRSDTAPPAAWMKTSSPTARSRAANNHRDKQAINRFGFFSGRFESGLLFTAAYEDERHHGKKTSQDWLSSHIFRYGTT
ncbi:hypothetical protein JNB88_18250 [Rhizobium cauense]|uniref:hypothetical protein n=1 Tax=Rhizobium cauense TaxID=1166683 RepID=UPI001C6E5500|nr:hypothetical protein [Rhizobium cauense]MBW9115582.1 hypothetical protein [Rhizobium cauense]